MCQLFDTFGDPVAACLRHAADVIQALVGMAILVLVPPAVRRARRRRLVEAEEWRRLERMTHFTRPGDSYATLAPWSRRVVKRRITGGQWRGRMVLLAAGLGLLVALVEPMWRREAAQDPLRSSLAHQVGTTHSGTPRPTLFPAGPEDTNVAVIDGRNHPALGSAYEAAGTGMP